MSRISTQTLWQTLLEDGFVQGECPPQKSSDSPWYIRTMLGLAGWLGSFFLLGFIGVGLSFVFDSPIVAMISGAILSGIAYSLFRNTSDNEFVNHFGHALGLAGQILLIFGIFELLNHKEAAAYGLLFAIEIILMVVMPNFIYRVIAVLIGAFSLGMICRSFGVINVAPSLIASGFALVWLQEIRWSRLNTILRPVGYGLALSLFFYRAGILWGRGFFWPRSYRSEDWLAIYSPWVGKALFLALFLTVVFVLIKRTRIEPTSRAGITLLVLAVLFMAASFKAPGIAHAMLVIVVGYAMANTILLGLGLLGFGVFLSNYYYMMQITLLDKSLLLLGLGAALLIGRLLVRKLIPVRAEGGQDHA